MRIPSPGELAILLPALIFALTIHEISHGLMAFLLGDQTAKRDGRLSLNPARHIDPVGLLFFIFAGFGWAKPVMVNPLNLRNPKIDMALISIAGPISNFLAAFVGLMIWYPVRYMPSVPGYIIGVLGTFCSLNIILGIFNLLPIPPLDGSKVLAGILPDSIYDNLPHTGRFGMILLLILILTNTISQVLIPTAGAVSAMLFSVVSGIYG